MIRTVFALLLLYAISWPSVADEAKTSHAILVIARAGLPDSNFKDSVVLVLNNIGPVPGGLIVNRPTKVTVASFFPDLKTLAALEDKVYFGGPVDMSSVSFLFRADTPPERAIRVLDDVYLSTHAELLRKMLARDKPMEGLRIFVGYAGWSPGQLENEIARGDWKVAPADADAIFGGKSEHPWPEPQAPDAGRRT